MGIIDGRAGVHEERWEGRRADNESSESGFLKDFCNSQFDLGLGESWGDEWWRGGGGRRKDVEEKKRKRGWKGGVPTGAE